MAASAEPPAPLGGAARPVRLHWLHLGFDDAALEREFLVAYHARSLGHVRALLLVLAGLGLLGGLGAVLADRLFTTATAYSPEFQRRMAEIDLGFVFAVSFALYLLIGRPRLRARVELVTGVYLFLFGPVAAYALAAAPRDLAWHGFTATVLHVFTIHLLARLRFASAAICSTAFTVFALCAVLAGFSFPIAEVARAFVLIGLANVLGMFGSRTLESYARREFTRARDLDRARARADRLLLNIMPEPVARRLERGERAPADRHDDVTILFADMVGFTSWAAGRSPEQVVGVLGRLFSALDRLAAEHRVEKIKTIGDAYMAVAGLPAPRDDHAAAVCRLALEMRRAVVEMAEQLGGPLAVRIGIHSGSVVAGVIGESRLAYDLWGDTVNVAARMESHGLPGEIQISAETRRRLPDEFEVVARGRIELKGWGGMETFLLVGVSGSPGSG